MTEPSAPAISPTTHGTTTADNADFMPMCERLLEMYMRRLGLAGRQMAVDPEELARVRRVRAPTPPADSCGARLPDGSLCARPPVEGRRRCRSHGCAPRTGAPMGNRNALKHGRFAATEIARGRRISEFIRECRETLREADKAMKGPA